jgi:hypothetical protein
MPYLFATIIKATICPGYRQGDDKRDIYYNNEEGTYPFLFLNVRDWTAGARSSDQSV